MRSMLVFSDAVSLPEVRTVGDLLTPPVHCRYLCHIDRIYGFFKLHFPMTLALCLVIFEEGYSTDFSAPVV